MSDSVHCTVDFNVNDNSQSVKAFLTRVQPVLELDGVQHWTIDLSMCQYLGPDAAALLYSTWLEGKRRGQAPAILLPEGPPPLKAFCSFSNLSHFIEGAPAAEPNHPKSETVPLRRLAGAVWTEPNAVIDLVRRHTDLATDEEDYLRLCMNEVIQNIEDHARSEIGGVWCARFAAAAKEVRIAIVDRGLGIKQTLVRRYPHVTSSVQALQCVFEGNYSSKSFKRNMGVGISNLARIITMKAGRLSIFTGGGLADLRPGRDPRFRKVGFYIPGTAVFFSLSTKSEDAIDGGANE